MERYFHDINCKIYCFEDFGALNPTLSPRSIYTYSKAVKNISNLENPEIVLGIMQFSPIYACCAKDFFFMKSKVVISYRGVVSEFFKRIPSFGRWAKFLVYYSIKSASNIIVPSEGIRRDLVEHFGASELKTKVIYNGIDLVSVKELAKADINLKKDCQWIATSCRLSPQKDFATLLNAFKIVRNNIKAKLVILGDGEMRRTIEDWLEDMGLKEDTVLLGFQENPFRYISKSDIFVLSSFFEGFGNVIVEAMALGIPVISTDCPSGPGEIINHGINGFLVPVGDYKKMAEYILNILNDNELWNKISLAGLKRAEDFSALKMAKNYEKLFLELTDSK
jgi:glycosyltransferase involved in cell wall biosynthesis